MKQDLDKTAKNNSNKPAITPLNPNSFFLKEPKDSPNLDVSENKSDPLKFPNSIFEYFKTKELKIRPETYNISSSHPELNQPMRGILINWLVEVREAYKTAENTLFLGVDLFDRFISCSKSIKQIDMPLWGITCLWIANKFEDDHPKAISVMVDVCKGTYEKKQIVEAEATILKTLDWDIYCPTIYSFISIYCESIRFMVFGKLSVKNIGNKKYHIEKDIQKLRHLINYIGETTLFYPEELLARFRQSEIAESCLLLALQMFGFNNKDLKEIAKSLDITITQTIRSCHQSLYDCFKKYSVNAPKSETKACYVKFKQGKYSGVSLITIPDQYPKLFSPLLRLSKIKLGKNNSSVLKLKEQEILPQTSSISPIPSELTPQRRVILINWLVEVQQAYKMSESSLFLGVDLFDRLIPHLKEIKRKSIQLWGITSLWMANKFKDEDPATLSNMAYVCNGLYKENEIIDAEKIISIALNWIINGPTLYSLMKTNMHWESSYCESVELKLLKNNKDTHHVQKDLEKLRHLIDYISETTLFYPEELSVPFKKSEIVRSCLLLALHLLGFNNDDLKEIANDLGIIITETISSCHQSLYDCLKKYCATATAPNTGIKASYLKFKGDKYSRVSLINIPDQYPELPLPQDQTSTLGFK